MVLVVDSRSDVSKRLSALFGRKMVVALGSLSDYGCWTTTRSCGGCRPI